MTLPTAITSPPTPVQTTGPPPVGFPRPRCVHTGVTPRGSQCPYPGAHYVRVQWLAAVIRREHPRLCVTAF